MRKDTVDDVASRVLALPEGSRRHVLFPVQRGSPDGLTPELKTRLAELRGKGFNRLYQSGRLFEFSTPESLLEIDFSRPLYALVDRLVIARNLHQRVVDAVETCFRESREAAFEPAAADAAERLWFSRAV